MKVRRYLRMLVTLAMPLTLLAVGLAPGSASATTAPGSWWSGHYDCGYNLDTQLHYLNGTNLTRADGWAIHLSDRTWAITGVQLTQYRTGGSEAGYASRDTGPTRSYSVTGIATSQLPWLRPAEKPFAIIEIWIESDLNLEVVNCPIIPFGQ